MRICQGKKVYVQLKMYNTESWRRLAFIIQLEYIQDREKGDDDDALSVFLLCILCRASLPKRGNHTNKYRSVMYMLAAHCILFVTVETIIVFLLLRKEKKRDTRIALVPPENWSHLLCTSPNGYLRNNHYGHEDTANARNCLEAHETKPVSRD